MWSTVIWLALAAGIFAWNRFAEGPFIGVRFTDQLIGFPLNGGWLCLLIALYCLVRFFVRRRRDRQNPPPRDA
ncbi:MAG: hypothetical protein GYA21_16240 [Myxococcales bacterium]|nr:hypothetical protein [Myxococcales bacterium]